MIERVAVTSETIESCSSLFRSVFFSVCSLGKGLVGKEG
jgi:hypothetical protein